MRIIKHSILFQCVRYVDTPIFAQYRKYTNTEKEFVVPRQYINIQMSENKIIDFRIPIRAKYVAK